MTWRRGYFERTDRDQSERLQRLAQEGKTIELELLEKNDEAIRIALGFGDEFWRVEQKYHARPREREVDGGKLIVKQGLPVADEADLAFLKKRVKRVVFST